MPEDHDDVAVVAVDQETLVRVLRHSDDPFYRACAATLLDHADNDFSVDAFLDAVQDQDGEETVLAEA